MANETLFTTKAADYAAGRPSYAPDAIERIRASLRPGERVADMGSGTGILSRELLDRGWEVFGIEPNPAMRSEAEKNCGNRLSFHSVAASAEHTGLPDASVAAVTAASAFHWFDPSAFYAECKRILKPGGRVYLLANRRCYDDPFTRQQHQLCRQYSSSFQSLSHGAERMLQNAPTFFPGAYRQEVFDFSLCYTKETFLARSLSSSYAPDRGTTAGEAYCQALRALIDQTFPDGRVVISNETVLLWQVLC